MPIEQLDVVPSRYRPTTFTVDMENFLSWMARNVPNYNALEQSLQLVGTTGTSTTSNTIGTGSKTFTTQTSKAWVVGSYVYVVSAASVSNMMIGQVTAYNTSTGSLTVNVVTSSGSGALASWIIGLSAPLGSSASFSGTVTAAVHQIDTGFLLQLLTGNPLIQFDANDYIWYDRTNNKMGFSVGSADRLTIDATDGPQRSSDASTSNGLVRKSQMDAVTTLATSAEAKAGTDSTKLVTPATLQSAKIIHATAVASTSGTAFDFTGIPAWAKRVKVMLSAVSTSGVNNLLVQLGTAGGVETSGYLGSGAQLSGSVANFLFTSGFGVPVADAAASLNGCLTFNLLNPVTNTWVCDGQVGRSDTAYMYSAAGSKALAGVLDRVRITTVGGSNSFDAGVINILWE